MRPLAVALGVLAVAAYPVLAHAAALSGRGWVALAAGLLLLVLVLWPALRRGRVLAMLALVAGAALLAWLVRRDLGMLPLYAPPVLLNGAAAWLFGRSLRKGRVPLLERVARVLHGTGQTGEPLDPAVTAYACRLTLAWTLLLSALAAANLVLALLAEPQGLLLAAGIQPAVTVAQSLWSLFANLLNHAIVVAFFVLEFLWRKRRFPQTGYRGLAEFGTRLARLGPDFWRRR